MSVKCLKCERPIDPFMLDAPPEESWEAPGHAVVFDGGYNFGSRLYDAPVGGEAVRVVVCDDCLERLRDDPELVKIVPVPKAWEKR